MSSRNVSYECPHRPSCLKDGRKKLCKDCGGLNRTGVIKHTGNQALHSNCNPKCPVYGVTNLESFPFSLKTSTATEGPPKCGPSNTHPKVLPRKKHDGPKASNSFEDESSETSSDTESRIVNQLTPNTNIEVSKDHAAIDHAILPTNSVSIKRKKTPAAKILSTTSNSNFHGCNRPVTKCRASPSRDHGKSTIGTGMAVDDQVNLIQTSRPESHHSDAPTGPNTRHPRMTTVELMTALTVLYLLGKFVSGKWAFFLLGVFLTSLV